MCKGVQGGGAQGHDAKCTRPVVPCRHNSTDMQREGQILALCDGLMCLQRHPGRPPPQRPSSKGAHHPHHHQPLLLPCRCRPGRYPCSPLFIGHRKSSLLLLLVKLLPAVPLDRPAWGRRRALPLRGSAHRRVPRHTRSTSRSRQRFERARLSRLAGCPRAARQRRDSSWPPSPRQAAAPKACRCPAAVGLGKQGCSSEPGACWSYTCAKCSRDGGTEPTCRQGRRTRQRQGERGLDG